MPIPGGRGHALSLRVEYATQLYILTIDANATAVRLENAAKHVHQRGLSGAVLTQQA